MKDELFQAVTEFVQSQDATKEAEDHAGISRDRVLQAVLEGLKTHFSSLRLLKKPQVTEDDIATESPTQHLHEVLSVIGESLGHHSLTATGIEFSKNALLDSISSAFERTQKSSEAPTLTPFVCAQGRSSAKPDRYCYPHQMNQW